MKDPSKRIEGVLPQRRKLIERLLEKKGLKVSPNQLAPEASEPKPDYLESVGETAVAGRSKDETRQFYDSINERLDSSIFGGSSHFLNLGYIANENRQYSSIELPTHLLDKHSIKLILETLGDADLQGRDVLDVGCGRGGTICVLHKYFGIKTAVGVDLSVAAIAFCKETHRFANTRFVQADAEDLPFDGASFDAVTNIESSCVYPNVFAFYSEMFRVLRPDGKFLYTDFFSDSDRVNACLEFLQNLGLILERDQDITSNVLTACDQIAARRTQALGRNETGQVITNFLAVPGSALYDQMKTGAATYRILNLRKP